jgi:hypothetical protein
MGILETCMQRWAILAFLVAISVGISIAANGGVTVQNNTPSNVGTNMASKISILSVNYTAEDQWVEISNNDTSNISFTGWKLINMMKAKTYSFPTGFSLIPGITVKVHSGHGNNTPTDLYNSKLAWDKTDTAILKDATGKIVSEYKYPIKVSAPGNVTKIKPIFLPNTFSISGQAGYKSDYGAERGSLKSNVPVNLSGRPFICHGGPLNWAWTTGLR